jgi:CTP synthase
MKYIFVSGGVLSGLGKGIVSASIGLLLKSRGYRVTAVKIDPYVSVDAGTMRPAEHGEVFVTHDGGEIDQDIGHYERFLDITLGKDNNLTTGKIFQNVIHKERHMGYGGRDVEVIPDIINEIKEKICEASKGYDFSIVEIGGTSGDLENMPFLHAAREIGREQQAIYVMVTFLPYLRNVGELKTKPTQHAVARLREIGIMPDFIVTRNEIPIDEPRIETIAKRCFVDKQNIIDDPDIDLVHKLPLMFEKKKFAEKILAQFGINGKKKGDLADWSAFIDNLQKPKKTTKIALVGKYVKHGASDHKDVYVSVLEALNHAASFHKTKLEVVPISSEGMEKLTDVKLKNKFKDIDGVVVPQGWGSRGTEGKIRVIQFARENGLPYLGLCFGMQMAVIEFARNVLKMKKANTEEADADTKYPVVHVMPNQKEYLAKNQYGGTIRLGAWPCKLAAKSTLENVYKKYGKGKDKPWNIPNEKNSNVKNGVVHERHRHRYEFNNKYKEKFEKAGMSISGTSPDGKLVEAIEIADHPFFVGTQFHPEYISRPLSPHPVFMGFIKVAMK